MQTTQISKNNLNVQACNKDKQIFFTFWLYSYVWVLQTQIIFCLACFLTNTVYIFI